MLQATDHPMGRANPRRLRLRLGLAIVPVVLGLIAVVAAVGARTSASAGTPLGFPQPLTVLDGWQPAPGFAWRVTSGGFTAGSGVAFVSDAASLPLAVLEGVGTPDSCVVHLRQVTAGSGVVFAYVDESNYWWVEASPAFGTWNIGRTVGGLREIVDNTGLTFESYNTTLTIEVASGWASISVDGSPAKTVRHVSIVDDRRFGMVGVQGVVGETRWQSFSLSGG